MKPLQCVFKSISNEGFQSSRTNTIMLNKVTTKFEPSNTDVSQIEKSHCFRITVRILGMGATTSEQWNVPLFILFRALGRISDKEIVSLIIYDTDEKSLKDKLYELLIPSIKDSQPIMDQRMAYKILSFNTKGKEVINVIELLKNNFFLNYKTNNEKSYFLGYSVRKLLLTHLKIIPETERFICIKNLILLDLFY